MVGYSRILVAALFLSSLTNTFGQSNVYYLPVIGYVPRTFTAGDNLFTNPLKTSTSASTNTLSAILSPSSVPNGTVVSLWNATTRTFDLSSTMNSGVWTIDFTLNPGTGARLTTPLAFTTTFVGEVQNHDGGPFIESLVLPPTYTGPDGLYLLGDKTAIGNSGTNIFLNILGRLPDIGEQVITLTTTSTYLGNGSWDSLPNLAVSEAAFLNVGPVAVPEPTVAAFTILSFAGLFLRRARN